MGDAPPKRQIRLDILTMSIVLAACVILIDLTAIQGDPVDLLAQFRYDDALRLVFIREWLEGGSWFDTLIDRLGAPEGTSLHWSRYFDLMIVGTIAFFSLFLPMSVAEGAAIVAFPTLLLIAFIVVSSKTAYRHFGRDGAAVTIAAIVLWEITARFYFGALAIDHHGLQILLQLVLLSILIRPAQGWRAGALAGIVAGFSLAVGLETLLPIILLGVILVIRCIVKADLNRSVLLAFGASLPIACLLLFVGQTPRIEWALMRCDELAPPMLALAASGGLAAAIIALSAPRIRTIPARIGLTLGASGLAVALSYPFVGHCLSGPYSNLPPDLLRDLMTIPETRPIHYYLFTAFHTGTVVNYIMPITATVALSMFFLARMPKATDGERRTREAVMILLAFAWLGILSSMAQIRQAVLIVPVAPILMGFAGARLIAIWRARAAGRASRAILIAGLAIMMIPGQVFYFVANRFPQAAEASAPDDINYVEFDHCRFQADVIRSLNALPPGNVISDGNMGQPILLLTHHGALAGPYHRGEKIMDGLRMPGDTDSATFLKRLETLDADYLVLCRNGLYRTSDTIATSLANGGSLAGLEPVEVDPQLVVFRVLGRTD